MGASTSAVCYLAGGDPPIVTAQDLTIFTERILTLDILDWDIMDVQLKFGQAIDQDDRSVYEMEDISEHSALMLDYDWDVEERRIPHAEALALLQHPPRSREVERKKRHLLDLGPKMVTEQFGPHVYRAHLGFGMLKEAHYQDICHELHGNYLQLTDLDFYLGVVELNDPQEHDVFHVGWMSFDISGNGYLFPWTYEETLEKLRAHRVLGQIRDICREMWPVTTLSPHPEVIRDRPKMGKLWAEPQDAPYDWYWAINETY